MELITEKQIKELLDKQNEYFIQGNTLSFEFRIEQLKKLRKTIIKYEEELKTALYKDLGKSNFETYTSEIGFVLSSITHTIKHLKKWMKPEKKKTPISLFLSKSMIIKEPYGSVYIIGPYNYPFQLIMEPLIGALSAGNCAVLSPSELTPSVSEVIKEIIKSTFEPEYVSCIDGGIENNTILLNAGFDYIFFTGSVNVGKIVMEAASKNLIPVTLELGGKSPVIIDKNVNLKVVCERILWGKLMNVGQTCVAPDYVFVHNKIKDEFLNEMKAVLYRFYGYNIKGNSDYGRIVNSNHIKRLKNILDRDKNHIFIGGTVDEEQRYIEPTILCPDNFNVASMQEEIFGPILPVFGYDDLSKALSYIRKNPKPLALYIFSNDKKIIKKIINNTSSGGVSINDTISHMINTNLPFGGVGTSGIGSYHGKYSFTTFSHHRSVLKRSMKIRMALIFPPFTEKKLRMVKKVLK